MASKKFISSLIVAGVLAASASTAAFADDRHRHSSGNGAAIAAGIIGAVVIGSLIANSRPAHAAPQPYYEPQPQVYYPQQPARQVYYERARHRHAPRHVTYVHSGYGERQEHRRDRHQDRRGNYPR